MGIHFSKALRWGGDWKWGRGSPKYCHFQSAWEQLIWDYCQMYSYHTLKMTFNISTLFKWSYCFTEHTVTRMDPTCILTTILKGEIHHKTEFTYNYHCDLGIFRSHWGSWTIMAYGWQEELLWAALLRISMNLENFILGKTTQGDFTV